MTFHHRVSMAALLLFAAALPAACGSPANTKSDAQLQEEIVTSMRSLVLKDIQGLNQAARDLQAAAPSELAGWTVAGNDTPAMTAMKEAWKRTRDYWERTEGTLSPLFPDLDEALDARYEDILVKLGGGGDPNPFDQQGTTGMHAVERILYAPGPQPVATYESSLAGYWPATWPATEQQAADFRASLCQRLVDDTQSLLDQWQSRSIDLGVVFTGLTGLLSSQAEKVILAADQQQESRYSETTMLDLRSNLAGTREIYQLFGPWLATKTYGTALNNSAVRAFDTLDQIYSVLPGEDIPSPPPTWSSNPNSPENLNSPFGSLYMAVSQAVDPSRSGSAVDSMNGVARALKLPEFTGQN